MKYGSLKKQSIKSFKVTDFDGGLNSASLPSSISDNQLSECKNVWYKNGRLQTRPGFNAEVSQAVSSKIFGVDGELKYNITDTSVYIDGTYYRVAYGEVLTDDYAYYIYVYLVDGDGRITPIGNMAFLRTASEIFYLPVNVLFYVGKPQSGGGIFAMVTVENQYNSEEKYYNFFEINKEYTEWERVYNFYIPTLYINGRGNKYSQAHSENGFTTESPKILESPNMLNGRFHAYFTSDGFSSLFRLPFTDLASETVICKIYYTLTDYLEWQVSATGIADTQSFFGNKVTLEVDREKGTAYFTCEDTEYAVPVMPMYHENNIKITATKEIENGIAKIIHSDCCINTDSSIILSGGFCGNEVYSTNYDEPLYFPQNSSVSVGNANSNITAFAFQNGKIIAFKSDGIYSLTMKKGDIINRISLLADNDRIFSKNDEFSAKQITKQAGCKDKKTVALCEGKAIWLGTDNNIYSFTSQNQIKRISDTVVMPQIRESFAFSDGEYYFLVSGTDIIVAQAPADKDKRFYFWQLPDNFKPYGGLYKNGNFKLLCAGENSSILYTANLKGATDTVMCYNENGEIESREYAVKSSITTKHYDLSGFCDFKNIDSMYLMLASCGKIRICVNGKEIANVNLRISREEYQNGEHKSVKIIPHLYGARLLYLTVESDDGLSIGELEIFYRKTG